MYDDVGRVWCVREACFLYTCFVCRGCLGWKGGRSCRRKTRKKKKKEKSLLRHARRDGNGKASASVPIRVGFCF